MKQVDLAIDYSVRELCYKPYPNHPKGCPNYGKKLTCPPKQKLIHEIIDLSAPVFAIWTTFDFGSHVERMKELHPLWSQRQAECCLYWQGTARMKLRDHIRFTTACIMGDRVVIYCPEACGVNVTETMKRVGEVLEWPPVMKTYQIAIAGQTKD